MNMKWLLFGVLGLALLAGCGGSSGSAGAKDPSKGSKETQQAAAAASQRKTASAEKTIEPPAGGQWKVIGKGTLVIWRYAHTTTGSGSDVQKEDGKIPFLVFERSDELALSEIRGKGRVKWHEEMVSSNCSFSADAKGQVTVSGIFYWEPECTLKMHIVEKWSQPTLTSQACGGLPLQSPKFDQTTVVSDIKFPLVEGYSDTASEMSATIWAEDWFKLTNLEIDHKLTGCVIGDQ